MNKLVLSAFAVSWLGMFYAAPPKKDYIGMVAAEAAYSALLPRTAPVKPVKPVDPKNCPTCGGTGRVRTGDDQHWTKCPTCQPVSDAAPVPAAVPASTPTPAPAKAPATPKPAGQGWPPRAVGQPLGNCPTCVYQSFIHS